MQRLSETDGVVTFNVSGKLFTTLRSTACLSPTLHKHVLAADANSALLKDGAVFIDRDPEVFGAVLTHLRNTAGRVTRPGAARSFGMVKELTVDLDTLGHREISSLWTEAQYFELHTLAEQTSNYHRSLGMLRRLHGASGGATSIASSLRQASLVSAALGFTWHVGSQEVDGSKEMTSLERAIAKASKLAALVTGS